jgi:hypothetical protein
MRTFESRASQPFPLTVARCRVYLAPMPLFLLLQSVVRPHSMRDWKLHGLDWLIDVGLDVAGVLLGAAVAWLVIRLVAIRIE